MLVRFQRCFPHYSPFWDRKHPHDCPLDARSVPHSSFDFLAHQGGSPHNQNVDNGSQYWKLQVASSELSMLHGHINAALSMPVDWAKKQWVMVYIFSDLIGNKYGFGAFVPNVET